MNTRITPPELLAPAGNLACALAAFDCGADAVYCGLKKFNARERTENFSFEEMSKLISYAHKRSKKVYVTFNTLVKEEELPEAASFLALLNSLAPDAVIVQDLGVAKMAKEFFPRLVLHGSTQMGLHNSAGLEFAKAMGLSRVIMERQTTLKELEMMLEKDTGIEVEMFIHGALCCCISGSCFLSSWLGGWSGNRGKCKQPCRRRYRSSQGNGFFLSAQDLCMVEKIPELMKLNIASFKIEGRLRRPDYVENVVSAYRLVMDAAKEDESGKTFREVLPKAKEILSHTCGRKWSEGFYHPQSAKNLVKHDAMGVSGLLAGKVTHCASNGFSVQTSRPLAVGDMLRIQPKSGDDGPSLEITKMLVKGRSAAFLPRNTEGFIFADKEIPRDGIIYKTSGKCKDYSARIGMLQEEKLLVDLDITLTRSFCSVTADFTAGKKEWRTSLQLEEAAKQPLKEEKILEEFQSWEQPFFRAGKIRVTIKENPFLPASVLKNLRKECVNYFAAFPLQELQGAEKEQEILLKRFHKEYAAFLPYNGGFLCNTLLVPRKDPESRNAAKVFRGEYRIGRMAEDMPSPREELVLPFYVSEGQLAPLEEKIFSYLEKGGRQIRISSLFGFTLLENAIKKLEEKNGISDRKKLMISTLMPLHVCNSFAASLLGSFGVTMVQASPELGRQEMEKLCAKSPLPVEIYLFGRPVLLGTRAFLPVEGKMEDSKGEVFLVEKEKNLTLILPEKTMEIELCKGASGAFYDCRNIRGGEKGTAHFNFDVTLA
ncbi:MAG: U32 family peptidase [Lentisphaeria bacterium]|nr:U32 family peptidase [Lentisphaeria bacterium]